MSRRINSILTLGISTAIAASGIFFFLSARAPHNSHATILGHARVVARTAAGGLPLAPSCPQATGQVSSNFAIKTNARGNNFDNGGCFYAPAGRPLTIHFTNSVYAVANHVPARMTLVISPSSKPAVYASKSDPHFTLGDPTRAVFVGRTVVAPNSRAFSVAALRPGSYTVQILEMPYYVATLVVQ